MAKGDWQVNDKNRVSDGIKHHANDSPYNNGTVAACSDSRSYNFVDRSHVGAVQLVSTISASMVSDCAGK
jgi:hypothetical protein